MEEIKETVAAEAAEEKTYTEKELQSFVDRRVTEALKTARTKFESEKKEAERLVRTELTFVQNEACAETYEKAGILEYEYLSASDNRVSKICKQTNGKRFYFKEKQVGKNFPPLHANCRCTILPIVE